MIPILCGFIVAGVILLLTLALAHSLSNRNQYREMYDIAYDDARVWKKKFEALDVKDLQAENAALHDELRTVRKENDALYNIVKELRNLNIRDYQQTRDHPKTIGGMNELEREAGCG